MRTPRAFSLPELAAVTLVAATGLAIASIGADRSRRNARCGEDLSHLREIGANTGSYAADFSDLFWTFSWHSGANVSEWPDLQFASDSVVATRLQMVDILRRHGRVQMPSLLGSSFVPPYGYSGLVLDDYLGAMIPDRRFVAAGSRQIDWANDPAGYDAGHYTPDLGHSLAPSVTWRYPYLGSFKLGVAFFDSSSPTTRITPYQWTSSFLLFTGPSGSTVGGRAMSEAAFPAQKVLLQDEASRYFGTPTWHSDPAARTTVLMVDGAASVRSYAEANPGANPADPAGVTPTQTYMPSVLEAPAASPPQVYPVSTVWTRMGMAGRDFGGPPVYP
jgi:hypothetical protein